MTDSTEIRISKSASIILNGKPENVFLLFGAFEERKWAHGWSPQLIYPQEEVMEEGVTFQTAASITGESLYTWIVKTYQPKNFLVEYLVFTQNRYWTITVLCMSHKNDLTQATITYAYTALNREGATLNRQALEMMYAENLNDWRSAINHYLETGQTANH